jgi:hypothetical protein
MRIYLDIDGVLHGIPRGGSITVFERKEAIEQLLREFTTAEVVISSSWRKEFSLEELRAFFSKDLQPRIIGVTPALPGKRRFGEIQAHLRETGYVGVYVILDDTRIEFPKRCPQLLLCDSEVGLDMNKLEELRARLSTLLLRHPLTAR